ncbi:MAG: ABC transporter permease, partial [Acidobacteriota bacterium]
MIFLENLRIALSALRANKMRSILTALGIIIGVAAVVAVVSIVQGLQFMITKELQGVGATYVMVLPFRDQNQGPGIAARQVKLTWDDGQAILAQVPGVKLITPLIGGRAKLKYLDRQHDPDFIFGVNDNWPDISNYSVDRGRFFSRLDLEQRRKVIVVGPKIVDELRLGTDPVGKEIYVGSVPATVIGVMEKRGVSLGTDIDNLAFIPFDTALTIFGRTAGESVQLRMQAESTGVVDQVKDGIKRLLRQRHKIVKDQPDDFQIIL